MRVVLILTALFGAKLSTLTLSMAGYDFAPVIAVSGAVLLAAAYAKTSQLQWAITTAALYLAVVIATIISSLLEETRLAGLSIFVGVGIATWISVLALRIHRTPQPVPRSTKWTDAQLIR